MGVDNVVACNSGSAALHLGLEAVRPPIGSEVLVPDFTMIACARAVMLSMLTPVFVDCDDNLLIDLNDAERKVTDRTVAIMPVHIYGRQCNMDELNEFACSNSLFIIEDCAEAHGVLHKATADVSCWSFYKNKIIAGEEGGAVSFMGDHFADRARQLRCQGFTPEHNFRHIPRGMNYRMSDCHAELILESLRLVEQNLEARRLVSTWYDYALPSQWKMPKRDVNWVYDLRINGLKSGQIDRVVMELNKKGIQARCGFKPMSSQPEFVGGDVCGNAHKMSREVMYLPITPNMTTNEVDRNVNELITAIERFK